MDRMTPTKEELSLWRLLALVRQAMLRSRMKEIAEYNVSPTKAYILSAIEDLGDKATPTRIAQWRLREPHSISEILSRMEKEGLVKRVRDLKNKSMVRIELTKKGQEIKSITSRRYPIHKIMSSLNKEQRQQLKQCLQILLEHSLKEIGITHEIHY